MLSAHRSHLLALELTSALVRRSTAPVKLTVLLFQVVAATVRLRGAQGFSLTRLKQGGSKASGSKAGTTIYPVCQPWPARAAELGDSSFVIRPTTVYDMVAALQCSGHPAFRQLPLRTCQGTPSRQFQAARAVPHAPLHLLRPRQLAARPARTIGKVVASARGAASTLQQVVRLAQEEAIRLGHTSCEPEHLLLGVLKEAGVLLAKARAAVKSPVRRKEKKKAFSDVGNDVNPVLPLSTAAERALTTAREERCSGLHVLGGLLTIQQSVMLLRSLGADPEDVLAQLEAAIEKSTREEAGVQDLVQSFSDSLAGYAEASPTGGPNETLEERAYSKKWQELRKQQTNPQRDPELGDAAEFEQWVRENGIQRIRQPSDQPTPLHLAAQAGDATAVRTLLTTGDYDVNAKGPGNGTPLHFAIRGGSLDVVQALLAAGADIEAVDFQCDTALHWAGIYARDSLVRPLLAAGSSIEALNNFDMTPLGVAAEFGHMGMIHTLLECGARVDGRGEMGNTPLILAAMCGSSTAIQTLLGAGAEISARGSDDVTALHYAANSGCVECGKLLLGAGADINAVTATNSFSALHLAAAKGHNEFVKLVLAAVANLEATASDGGTALHQAAQEGQVEALQELLAAGADLHARNKNGETPLDVARTDGHLKAAEVLQAAAGKQQLLQGLGTEEEASRACTSAAAGSRPTSAPASADDEVMQAIALMELLDGAKSGSWSGDTVRWLEELGANVPKVNSDLQLGGGPSFLHQAAEQGNIDVVQALVESGVDPSLPTRTALRVPAIHYACINSDHAEVVDTLLQQGASVDERDAAGYTTLATAAEAGSLECVKALLAHGADVSARNDQGLTVLMDACVCDPRKHNPQTKAAIVRLLLAAGADPTAEAGGNSPSNMREGFTALHYAAQFGNVGAIEALLEDGRADLEAATERAGWRPLHQAAGFGGRECHPRVLLALLEAGADINAASHDGTTALHLTAMHGFTNAIELLAAAGADLGAPEKDGNTALHLAVKNNKVHAVAALVEAGAPINATNAAGRTPLGEARRMGHGALVTFLQRHSI